MQALSTSIAGAMLFTALAWHCAFFMPTSWVPMTTLEVLPISRLSASACRDARARPVLLHVGETSFLVGEEGQPPVSLADGPSLRRGLRGLQAASPHRTHVIVHVADDATHERLVTAVDAALGAGLTGVQLIAGPDVTPFELASWSRPERDDDDDHGCCG